MKLDINKNGFANPNYQHVTMYNAQNVGKPRNILDLELYDEETKTKFTLRDLLTSYNDIITNLQEENKQLKQDLENKTKRLLEIIVALKEEAREGGVI